MWAPAAEVEHDEGCGGAQPERDPGDELRGPPRVVFGFTIRGGKIAEIELLADPEFLGQVDLEVLGD